MEIRGARAGRQGALVALVATVALTVPSAAAEWRVRLDTQASAIRFSLGATLHTVRGTASWAAGPQELSIDPATGAASGRLVVDATSLETGNERRDRKMHADVLESEAFPEIVFTVRRVTGLPELGLLEPGLRARVEIVGELELHGGIHPMALAGDVARDGERLTGTAAFEIPYVSWGLEDPSKAFLRVEKVVEVEIELVARLEIAPPTAPDPE